MCFGGMWVLSPFSMEQNHYSGTALKGITFSPDHTEALKYQNGCISFPKMVMPFFDFKARQRKTRTQVLELGPRD